ncbi:MAG: hypothetical protein ACD_43C00286G0016 [uncultured bacterium]|nr:MAG: hypothetical protein ACD_43C00286G0016 [uncultured bacterium]
MGVVGRSRHLDEIGLVVVGQSTRQPGEGVVGVGRVGDYCFISVEVELVVTVLVVGDDRAIRSRAGEGVGDVGQGDVVGGGGAGIYFCIVGRRAAGPEVVRVSCGVAVEVRVLTGSTFVGTAIGDVTAGGVVVIEVVGIEPVIMIEVLSPVIILNAEMEMSAVREARVTQMTDERV